MDYGISPSHREQQRRKQIVRLFIEERLIDLGHVVIATGNAVCDLYDFTDSFARKTVKFCIANKRYTLAVVIGISVILAMVL